MNASADLELDLVKIKKLGRQLEDEMKKTQTSYNLQASSYEKRWKDYLTHTHREFLQRVEVNEDDRILDVSCGTGLLAEELVSANAPFSELVLNDISHEMISIAKKRLNNLPNVSYSEFPAGQIQKMNKTFDLIICLNAFHHYEHQTQVVQNFHGLLASGGKVCILDWNRIGLFRPVNSIIKRFSSEHIDTRSEIEVKELLTETGFQIKVMHSWAFRYWRFYFFEAVKIL
jgi:2-polyprenyl-3-methyl-5-hydroxy-6-metoxy-1,4-benzoquinol methylase